MSAPIGHNPGGIGTQSRALPRPIDVIVSDIGLEGEDGLTLMRRVRERSPERGGKVPAIAVSAYGGAADRIRAFEAGYQTYITKPLNPAEVIAAVAALVRLVWVRVSGGED
jgi:DNA-binding response OmpR family regulator